MRTTMPTDGELRKAFGDVHVHLLHLAASHWLKGDEDGKQLALDAALIAFMKEHQVEPLGPDDWGVLDFLPSFPA
jgi:hypothetical protein